MALAPHEDEMCGLPPLMVSPLADVMRHPTSPGELPALTRATCAVGRQTESCSVPVEPLRRERPTRSSVPLQEENDISDPFQPSPLESHKITLHSSSPFSHFGEDADGGGDGVASAPSPASAARALSLAAQALSLAAPTLWLAAPARAVANSARSAAAASAPKRGAISTVAQGLAAEGSADR
mmetsp:Transcript_96431/g.259348  ORF Transcript_96431/g.259348 Transcript_96431/m.259348 type:complete len:182 (-) Transcript_96431:3-548(-)